MIGRGIGRRNFVEICAGANHANLDSLESSGILVSQIIYRTLHSANVSEADAA